MNLDRQNIKKIRTANSKKIGLYIFLLLLVLAIFIFTDPAGRGKLAPVEFGNSKGDTIDVAVIYGPLSYYIYADSLGGINYDFLRYFEKDTHTPLKFWPVVSLSKTFEKLEDGTYDLLASVPSDYSIKQRFLTTQSIFLDRLVLIQRKDSEGNVPIKSALDLANQPVYVAMDSPAEKRLQNLSSEIGDPIEIIKEKDLSEEYLCMKVGSGEIDFAVVNEKTAKSMMQAYSDLSFDSPVSFTQFQVWVLPKNDSLLLKKIDKWFVDFKKSSLYRETISKF